MSKKRIEDVKENIIKVLEKRGQPLHSNTIFELLMDEKMIGNHMKMGPSRLSSLMSFDKKKRFVKCGMKDDKNLWWINNEIV